MIVRECNCTQKLDDIEAKMWILNITGGVIIRRQKKKMIALLGEESRKRGE